MPVVRLSFETNSKANTGPDDGRLGKRHRNCLFGCQLFLLLDMLSSCCRSKESGTITSSGEPCSHGKHPYCQLRAFMRNASFWPAAGKVPCQWTSKLRWENETPDVDRLSPSNQNARTHSNNRDPPRDTATPCNSQQTPPKDPKPSALELRQPGPQRDIVVPSSSLVRVRRTAESQPTEPSGKHKQQCRRRLLPQPTPTASRRCAPPSPTSNPLSLPSVLACKTFPGCPRCSRPSAYVSTSHSHRILTLLLSTMAC
jgi:hypothetical protein